MRDKLAFGYDPEMIAEPVEFVAGGQGGLYYSYDGIIWKNCLAVPNTLAQWRITTNGSRYVAIPAGSDIAIYSDNGVNWKETTLPVYGSWLGVAASPTRFVAVDLGMNGTTIYSSNVAIYSDDGVVWKETTLPAAQRWSNVCYNGSVFIATGSASDGVPMGLTAYSTDGEVWTSRAMPIVAGSYALKSHKGRFVAVYRNCTLLYSNNGISWTRKNLPVLTVDSDGWHTLATNGDTMIALPVARTQAIGIYSVDGIDWTTTLTASGGQWLCAASNGSMFVAFNTYGQTSSSMYSYNGIDWTSFNPGPGYVVPISNVVGRHLIL